MCSKFTHFGAYSCHERLRQTDIDKYVERWNTDGGVEASRGEGKEGEEGGPRARAAASKEKLVSKLGTG